MHGFLFYRRLHSFRKTHKVVFYQCTTNYLGTYSLLLFFNGPSSPNPTTTLLFYFSPRRHEIQCNAMAPLFSQKYMDVAYFNILFNIRNKFVLLDSL